MTTIDILIRVIPIFACIALGYFLTRIGIVGSGMIDGFKKIIVNVTLPATLISIFIKIRFEAAYVWIIVAVFTACIAMLFVGKLLAKAFGVKNRFFPFLLAGFEAGMLGYPLYAMVFGSEAMPNLGVVDIGHVFFVFVVFVPVLIAVGSSEGKGLQGLKTSLMTAVRSPVVWAILIGVAGSLAGLWVYEGTPAFSAVDNVLQFLSAPTAFLICIVIGSGLKFSLKTMRFELFTALLKIAVSAVFAAAIHFAVLVPLGLAERFSTALFIVFVLPAPFVLPVFMKDPTEQELGYVSGTLSIGSLLGVTLFAVIILTGL